MTSLAGTRGSARTCPSWRHEARARRLAVTVPGNSDGQHVPGSGDGEPEHRSRPRRAHPTRRDRPPQRCSVRHRAARDAAAADLGNPVPGPPITRAAQARQPDNHRHVGRCALKPGVDLSQPPSPVRVILRRHPASVLRHQAKMHSSAAMAGIPAGPSHPAGQSGQRSPARSRSVICHRRLDTLYPPLCSARKLLPHLPSGVQSGMIWCWSSLLSYARTSRGPRSSPFSPCALRYASWASGWTGRMCGRVLGT